MTASTTIIIPGRETQTINGLKLSKADVIASFAGDIDLSSMESSETSNGDAVTITFRNRTGTKGSDINIAVSGDLVINNTRVIIPGREAQTISGIALSIDDVVSAFAGDVDLSRLDSRESVDGDTRTITFSNRTGTKGQVNIIEAIARAVADAAPVEDEEDDDFYEEGEDDDVELVNTRIIIPGRETQTIMGMVLDSTQVKESFQGDIDLSSYDVSETEIGNTLEVRFTARTGTKG